MIDLILYWKSQKLADINYTNFQIFKSKIEKLIEVETTFQLSYKAIEMLKIKRIFVRSTVYLVKYINFFTLFPNY